MKNIRYIGLAFFVFLMNIPNQTFAQGWNAFTPTKDYFFISNVENNKVLDIAGSATKVGANVVVWTKHQGKNQQFRFIEKGDGYYAIETALKKQMYLSIHNVGTADQTNIKLNNPVGRQQHFKIEKNTLGQVRFLSKLGTNLFLGIDNTGKNVVIRKGDQGKKIRFKLVSIENKGEGTQPTNTVGWSAYSPPADYFFLSNIKHNKVLDVAGSKTEVGTNVVFWGKHEGKNQQFKFIGKGDGYYAIETALKKDIYLSVHNSGITDQTNVKLNNPVGQQQYFKIEKNEVGAIRFISKLGNDLFLGMNDAGNNLVLRKGDQGAHLLFKLIPTSINQSIPNNSITEPVLAPDNIPLTTFRAIDKDGLAILEYQYKNKEDENNFSTECSLPDWLPKYDITTTSKKYLDIFDPACHVHDRNYRAPWRLSGFEGYTGREIADEKFYADMVTICETRYKDDWTERQYCKTVAQSWYLGVHKSPQGKDAYDSGQRYAKTHYNESSIKTGGIIYVNSEGSYIGKMEVDYLLNNQRVRKKRTLEPMTSDEISIPLGASDINVHVYGTVHASDLDFRKKYPRPVKQCFEISGKYKWSGYDASWKEITCQD